MKTGRPLDADGRRKKAKREKEETVDRPEVSPKWDYDRQNKKEDQRPQFGKLGNGGRKKKGAEDGNLVQL